MNTFHRFLKCVVPFNKHHSREAITIFIGTLQDIRREKPLFRNQTPRHWYMPVFEQRYKNELKYGTPLRQEAGKWSSVIAYTLTIHFAVFKN